MFDKRKVFDRIPEQFDKWRPRYSQELFDYIVSKCKLDKGKSCLEIGPGTGQATDFVLKIGCDYLAIELGEHLADYMKEKYKSYTNFHIVNADFEKYPLKNEQFDFVYSAAAIQWIPEEIAFSKCYNILKPNGYLAMFLTSGQYKMNNLELYHDIQEVYDEYFVSESPYRQKFDYENATQYGFKRIEKRESIYSRRICEINWNS